MAELDDKAMAEFWNREKILAETSRLVGSIRKARVQWCDARDDEIAETIIPCMPGDTITIRAPHPSDTPIE